jgi:hypothetical protein
MGIKNLMFVMENNLIYIKELHNLVWKGLEKYIVIDKIGGETFNGWSGFSLIRFNRYNKNQIMSKHCDHIKSLFTGDRLEVFLF